MSDPLPASTEPPDAAAPLGSWPRAYAFVVVFFLVEVCLFAWLTWSVS